MYLLYLLSFSLLDAVMKEPVLIQHDDDVEVFNNDEQKHTYYQTRGPPTIDDEM